MRNPWSELPLTPPFVLPEDAELLQGQRFKPKAVPQLSVPPSPFIGDPQRCRVVMLLLNPGYSEEDLTAFESSQHYRAVLRSALLHQTEPPMWSLDERLSETGAYRWSTKRCRVLAEHCGWEALRQGLMQVQFFPYKSVEFQPLAGLIPSQTYGFWLVRQAIESGKEIILTRSRKLWLEAVPELEGYPFVELRNPRSPYLTAANMGSENFARVVAALQA